MVIGASVPYSPLANVTPAEGVPDDRLRVQANPEDFGAQVGQATQKLGSEGEQVAKQWGGLIAETQANQSELGYIKSQGDLKAKYSQYEGLQADAMRPQYEQESIALQQKYKESLSPEAGRMFDAATRRSLGNDISQYSGYAAGQVKKANMDSFRAVGDLQIAKTGDPTFVMDEDRFMSGLGALRHANNALADHQDLGFLSNGKDENTGLYTFPDTQEGNDAKARYQQLQDTDASKYYMGAVRTLAATNPVAAAAFVDKYKDTMPDLAKAEAQQYLAPKIMTQSIDGAVAQQNQQVESGWQQNVLSGGGQQDLLGIIHRNEGFTGKVGRDSNGANVINGVNEKAFPDEYASIKSAYDKSKDDGDAATNDFFQKNIIDKYDIKSLPPATQAIVADGLVNHGTGEFGQSLLTAAKSGASPQDLIDMRHKEYQRLADSDVDGSKGYASSLKGWNNRLDGLEPQAAGQPTYANRAEYLESIKDDYVRGTVNSLPPQYADNLAIQQTTQRRAELNINAQISNAKSALKSDTDTLTKAINGGISNGKVPMTPQELSSLPNVSPILDRVAREQPEFYKSIETRIAKAAHGDASTNTPNGYDAITNALDASGNHDRQSRIEYLSKGLGSDNPGFSISQKDFNDAKPALDLEVPLQSKFLEQMKNIATANGNVDGKGQERAVQWYNNIMAAWKQNAAKGDKAMSPDDFVGLIKDKAGMVPNPPSRMQQINNVVQQQVKNPPQVFTGKAQFDAAPSGTIYIRDGIQYRKP